MNLGELQEDTKGVRGEDESVEVTSKHINYVWHSQKKFSCHRKKRINRYYI